MFCHSESAVPWYHCGPRRCCAGMISMNSPNSPRRKPQPLPMCWISECALYCVSTEIWRMPELRQFDSTKSMMRNLPPNGVAGLQRSSVSCLQPLAASARHDHGERAAGQPAQVSPRGEDALLFRRHPLRSPARGVAPRCYRVGQ